MKANDKIVGEPEEVIKKCLGLVWKGVYRYKGWLKSVVGVEMNDLYSVGCIGLIRAYELYDPNKGISKFEHYAYPRICTEINRFINDYNSTLSFPRRAKEAYNKIYKRDLLNSTPKEIMEQTDIPLSDILIALEYSKWKCISIDITIGAGEGTEELTIQDMLISFNDLESNINIKEIFDIMDDREKLILYLYYYEEKTTTQISKIINISQPHISRLMKKIKQKLTEYSMAI